MPLDEPLARRAVASVIAKRLRGADAAYSRSRRSRMGCSSLSTVKCWNAFQHPWLHA